MRIAITGATGLVGRALGSILSENHSLVLLSHSNASDKFVFTDYSVDSLKKVLVDVDVVVHLAANRFSTGSENDEFRINEDLTKNVLLAMKECTVKRIVYLSSISVYSDLNELPWNEQSQTNPRSLYAISKLKSEQIVSDSFYSVDYLIFRCAHIIGVEQPKYMINIFMNAARNKQVLEVRGKSVAKREFIYVKDVANAIQWAIEKNINNQIINLGYGKSYTNYEIAELINSAFRNPKPIKYDNSIDEGITSSCMDISVLRELGFKPSYSVDSAFEDIAKEVF